MKVKIMDVDLTPKRDCGELSDFGKAAVFYTEHQLPVVRMRRNSYAETLDLYPTREPKHAHRRWKLCGDCNVGVVMTRRRFVLEMPTSMTDARDDQSFRDWWTQAQQMPLDLLDETLLGVFYHPDLGRFQFHDLGNRGELKSLGDDVRYPFFSRLGINGVHLRANQPVALPPSTERNIHFVWTELYLGKAM